MKTIIKSILKEKEFDFEKFYHDMYLYCVHIARRITNDHALAEDAVHNGFMEFLKKKDRYFGLDCDKMKGLIVIIVKNKAIDIMRACDQRAVAYSDDALDICDEGIPSYDDRMIKRETYDQLIACMKQLREPYKMMLRMRYYLEMTTCEMATELGISETSVSTRLTRARKKLAQLVNEEASLYVK